MNINLIPEKYLDLMIYQLDTYLDTIDDYELLFSDIIYCSKIYKQIFLRNFNKLLINLTNQYNLLDVKYSDIENFGDKSKQDGLNVQKAAGFDLTNEDGDFSKQTSEINNFSQNKLLYLDYFKNNVDEWAVWIIDVIKSELLRIYY